MGDAQNQVWQALSEIADRLTKGEKAIPVTEALIVAGLVENPQRIRRIARENEQVLNRYFEQLDANALVSRLSVDQAVTEQVKTQSSKMGKTLALIGAGGLATVLFQKLNS
jgi:hypothetical protein